MVLVIGSLRVGHRSAVIVVPIHEEHIAAFLEALDKMGDRVANLLSISTMGKNEDENE